jgi:hypothetical protein
MFVLFDQVPQSLSVHSSENTQSKQTPSEGRLELSARESFILSRRESKSEGPY